MDLIKVKNDPFYSDLYDKYGEEFIINAGYFDSPADQVILQPEINCTPVNFLLRPGINVQPRVKLGNKKEPTVKIKNKCVLVTTGSFAPIHSGHIDMMVAAKKQMQENGYEVLGGYFCPDHDAYISEKLGDKAININERINQIELSTRNHFWLAADPWMGLYCNADVNFTVVIDRLVKYINTYFNTEGIEVVFVCGEDRVNFADTFRLKGRCVVVRRSDDFKSMHNFLNRINADLDTKKISREDYDDFFKRVLFETNNTNHESSTNVRRSYTKTFKKKKLILRYDSREDKKLYQPIIDALKPYYNGIILYDIAKQQKEFEAIKAGLNIINLDPYMDGHVNIPISREYDFFGFKFLGYTVRPEIMGYLSIIPIEKLITDIIIPRLDKEKTYWLFDDDICGGSVMKFVRDIFREKGINIGGIITFLKSTEEDEVMDIRDLMVGHKNGGLVINGRRVPYIYPYVDPYIRASIDNPDEFSKKITKINDEYTLTLEDVQEKWRSYLAGL